MNKEYFVELVNEEYLRLEDVNVMLGKDVKFKKYWEKRKVEVLGYIEMLENEIKEMERVKEDKVSNYSKEENEYLNCLISCMDNEEMYENFNSKIGLCKDDYRWIYEFMYKLSIIELNDLIVKINESLIMLIDEEYIFNMNDVYNLCVKIKGEF